MREARTISQNPYLYPALKKTHLNPILITLLSSGKGIYRSPFEDIWGSRITLTGPHTSFTRTSSNINTDISHEIFHTKELERSNSWL